jgi:peroxiredoxin
MQERLAEFEAAGVQPVAISIDTPRQSLDLSRKAHYTFPILSDPGAKTIRQYGVLHEKAGENGADIARPAEFLVDRNGTVRWANLTEDFRVRARPQQLLEAARRLP